MSFKDCPKFAIDDDYMTPKYAWEQISEYIPKDKVIWECFYGDGKSGQHLRDLGCLEVIHEPIDFFTNNNGEVLISNMPFTIKQEVFARLKELDKPFIMLVPSSTIQSLYWYELFGKNAIQIILPCRKVQYLSPTKTLKKSGCSFNSVYVCYKIGLPRDVVWI